MASKKNLELLRIYLAKKNKEIKENAKKQIKIMSGNANVKSNSNKF